MTGPTAAKILIAVAVLAAVGLTAGERLAAPAPKHDAPQADKTAAGQDAAPEDHAAASGPKERPAAAKAGATEGQRTVSYPVVTVAPAPRSFQQAIRGFGAIKADARSARVVSMATVGVVRSVDVLPGERVARGQPLLTVEPDPLAHLAYQQALSAEKLARAEVARLTAQRADHLATASQQETAEKSLADAQAGLEAARRQGATAGAEVLRAPADGIVTAVGVAIGDRPALGTALAAVTPANAARVLLGIEPGEARLAHVAAERSGRVAVVGASLEKDTRLVNVAVALDQPGFGGYLAGSAVEATIETAAIAAFSVPRTAVVKDDDGTAVFEVVGGKARRVAVVVEVDEGARVGVSGELDRARPIVATGAYELEDGVTVAEHKP